MFSVYVKMGKLSIILSCRFSFWNDQNSNKMHAVQKNGIVFTVHTQQHGTHTHTLAQDHYFDACYAITNASQRVQAVSVVLRIFWCIW